MTGDQRHENDIKNRQRVSRQSLPTLGKTLIAIFAHAPMTTLSYIELTLPTEF